MTRKYKKDLLFIFLDKITNKIIKANPIRGLKKTIKTETNKMKIKKSGSLSKFFILNIF